MVRLLLLELLHLRRHTASEVDASITAEKQAVTDDLAGQVHAWLVADGGRQSKQEEQLDEQQEISDTLDRSDQ